MNIISIVMQALAFLLIYPACGVIVRGGLVNALVLALIYAVILSVLLPIFSNLWVRNYGYYQHTSLILAVSLCTAGLYLLQLVAPHFVLILSLPGALLAGFIAGVINHVRI